MKYFLLSFILFFCSCSSTFNSVYKDKQLQKTIDVFIELGEKDSKNNKMDKFLLMKLSKTDPEKEIYFSNFGIEVMFYEKKLPFIIPPHEYSQFEYKGYSIIIIDSNHINFKKYSFLKPVKSEELKTLDSENMFSYNPTAFAIFFDKKGVIQFIDPMYRRKSLREMLLKKNIKINLKSKDVYNENAIGVD